MSAVPPAADDDDRTRALPQTGPPALAAAEPAPAAANALPPGTRLDEFELLGVIGVGGFGIVYLAYDHSLERKVAIKEYMPAGLAARTGTTEVRVSSARHADAFAAGMRSFINEARLLASFDHPALLKVYRFWEANGSAYMAMPYLQGQTLTQALRAMGHPPDERWLLALLAPLLEALETLHCARCFHRDIAPDNIMMLPDGHPLLLDFGAARRAIAGMVQNFTVILKPGYAPVEQYGETPAMRQGPWTDIYALAAVVHFAILGRPPLPAVARMVNDTQVPLASSAAGLYSARFLAAIDRALAVRPADRPQSIAELRALLRLPAATPQSPQSPPSPPAPGETPAPARTPALRYLAAAALAVLALAAGGWYLWTRPAPSPGTAARTAERPVPQAGTAPTPVSPIAVLDQIVQHSNRDHAVTVLVSEPRVRIGKGRLHFSLRSSRPGYVYLLMVGSDRSQFWLLFPNDVDQDNHIAADRALDLPRPGWTLEAAGPPGIDQLLAIVSETPRDFRAVGLRSSPPYAEFPLTGDKQAASPPQAYAGVPHCADGAACPQSYGAALFSIEEVAGP